MIRDPREDHRSPVDDDAAAEAAHPLDRASQNGSSAGRPLGPVQNAVWVCTALEALPRAICTLSRPEQRLVIGCFFEHRPVDELARELRLTPTRATALLGDALRTLRVKIGG